MVVKSIIEDKFSKYAYHYDEYCDIQNNVAKRLSDLIELPNVKNILDIGCGTGNYTQILHRKFPNADILGIDISREMLEIASSKIKREKIKFIRADAEKLTLNKKFDLITSNASFQWLDNFENALFLYRDYLTIGGKLLFSMFGPGTYSELSYSLRELKKDNLSITADSFITKEKVSESLESIFSKVTVREMVFKECYSSLGELLKKIKYTGTTGTGYKINGLWTPKRILDIESIYKKNFTKIVATYQVLFCEAY